MPDVAFDVLQACRTGAAEIAAAWQRAFDAEVQFQAQGSASATLATLPAALSGPGLFIQVAAGNACRYWAVPHHDAMLPSWYRAPDPTGASKLTTLAQELGMLLLDDDALPDVFTARHVENLQQTLAAELPGLTEWQLTRCQFKPAGADAADAFLFWGPSSADARGAAAKPPVRAQRQAAPAGGGTSARGAQRSLPAYSRSLLKIRVPVSVTLAHKKQLASQILELGPGAIIQFDRSCEETLDLEVGGLRIALGEAVKVGDKFGLRITEMVRPGEQYVPLKRPG